MSYQLVFDVKRGDFDTAGEASRKIKRTLQQLGVSNKVIRKVSIAGYEGEMNLAIHSSGGKIVLEVGEAELVLTIEDTGPGIANVDLAMTAGWSPRSAAPKTPSSRRWRSVVPNSSSMRRAVAPVAASSATSLSTNGRPKRAATNRPMVVLPHPIAPMSTM